MLDARRKCSEYGGMECWWLEAYCGVDVEAWNFGALESRCRYSDTEVWMYAALEESCKNSDVEVRRYGLPGLLEA